MSFSTITTSAAPLLTGWHHPRSEYRFQDVLCDVVGDEVEVEWVLAVKQKAFDQRHDVARRVILGTDNCNVYYLQSTMLLLN